MYPTIKTFGELFSRISQTKETFIITKTLDLKPSIVSITKSLPEIIKLLKTILAFRKLFLCEVRSVNSSFIVSENEIRKVILNMDE